MSHKNLYLKWQDGRSIEITLLDNPAAEYYRHCIKHLQHVDLVFDARKNPLHPQRKNLQILSEQIQQVAKKLNINIDQSRLHEQQYLNQLHNIYLNNTDGKGCNDSSWLHFHDLIHCIEDVGRTDGHEAIWFDYENLAGPLVKSFDQSWLQYAVFQIPVGLCYLQAHELGKTVKKYIKDQEPFDLVNMCRVMKPWIDLKPVMNLSVVAQDRLDNLKTFKDRYTTQFEHWENNFQKDWMEFWNLDAWSIVDESAALPIGYIKDIQIVLQCFRDQDYPVRITH